MNAKPIVFRPDKEHPELEKDLKEMAKKKKWSLNKYIVITLAQHVKNKKK